MAIKEKYHVLYLELYIAELVLTNVTYYRFQNRYQNKTMECCVPAHFKLAKGENKFLPSPYTQI